MSDYLTPTVVAICHRIRDKKDYDAAAILADALEDDGYRDQDILQTLRDHHRFSSLKNRPIWIMRAVCKVLGGEYARAVEWLDNFIYLANREANIDRKGLEGNELTYERLIETLIDNIPLDDDGYQLGEPFSWDHIHEPVSENDMKDVWRHYQIVMNDERAEGRKDSVFVCGC